MFARVGRRGRLYGVLYQNDKAHEEAPTFGRFGLLVTWYRVSQLGDKGDVLGTLIIDAR